MPAHRVDGRDALHTSVATPLAREKCDHRLHRPALRHAGSLRIHLRYSPAVLRSSCALLACSSILLACARQTPHLEAVQASLPNDLLGAALQVEPTPLEPDAVAKYLIQVSAEADAILTSLGVSPSASRTLAAFNRHFFGQDGFVALHDQTTEENTSVAAVLNNRRGTCMGLAIVYLAMAERLGLSAHAVPTPVHLFIRVQLEDGTRNVELLEEGHEIPDDLYLRRDRIAEASIERGVFLRDLTNDEVIAHLLSNQATALSRDGRLDDALARYDHALELAPQLVVAYYNRGIDFMNTGRLEEAIVSFDRAIDLHPNDAQAYNKRGITKARLGDMEGARADFQRALELEPGMREAEENLRKLE